MRHQDRRVVGAGLVSPAVALAIAAMSANPAAAQVATKPDQAKVPAGEQQQIVVTGDRRTAIADVQPVATFNSDDIAATGATSMSELLQVIKPITDSADGEPPIFLLNGQRTSGYQDIASLPPESIQKVEVLPEPAALKYGYPPTRRVLNFITKRSFRQIEARASAGTTTRPGSTTVAANANLTRLHNDSRLTLAVEGSHTSPILQSERDIAPDPDVLFDSLGNVTAADSGEIDPALSAIAGEPVTVAPVPQDASERSNLAAYAAAANQPRLFDLGPYRDLKPANDSWKAEGEYADRLGGTLSGSINLSAEQSTDRRLEGPAAATLTVPASNPSSPFSSTVLLQRYLTEAAPLRDRTTTTSLHGGGTLRGVTAGWRWDATAVFDQKLVSGVGEKGIDVGPANAAIAAGADPFEPLEPSLLSGRLVDRTHLLTRNFSSKLVATNTPVALPAGEVTVTGTLEAERQSANSVTTGADPFDLSLARTRTEAGGAIDVPLTSRRNEVLPAIGDVSVNASGRARRISGFGALYDSTLGLNWSPFQGVQLLVQDKNSATAPDMEKLASPIVHVANSLVFDYATGRTDVVTVTQGGNPDLAAAHKHVRSITLNVKPFPERDLRVSATLNDTDLRDQTGDIYALTPELEAIFPERATRDSSGQLVAVTYQPTNFYRQRQRSLHMTISANGSLGPKPPGAKQGDKDKNRPHYYAGAGPTIRFSDRLQLRPGTPELDLLDGDTVSGSGTPRVTSYFYGGIGYLGNGVSIDGWYQSGDRVRSDTPAADLTFSGIFKLNVGAYISVHHFLPGQDWTRHLQLKLDVQNITDAHVHVVDANGDVPNRFQADYLDPVGRTVKLTLRKLL